MAPIGSATSPKVVSGLLLDYVFRFVEEHGGDADALAHGIPGGRAALTSRLGWVDWDTYIRIESRVAEQVSGLADPYLSMGRHIARAPRLGFLRPAVLAMSSPTAVYRVIPRLVPRFFLRCVEVDLSVPPGKPDRLRLHYRFLYAIQPTEALLATIAGQLMALPRLFGFPEAEVDRSHQEDGVSYAIRLPTGAPPKAAHKGAHRVPGRDWLGRGRRRALVEELLSTNELLAQKVEELDAVNHRLRESTRMAEEARREAEVSEARYRVLTEAAQDAIYVLDPDGTVAYANGYVAALIGADPEALIGRPVQDVLPPEVAEMTERGVASVLRDGTCLRSTHTSGVTGAERWYDSQLVPVPDGDGGVSSVLGITRDVTARRRMEQEQEEQARRESQRQRLESLGVLAGGIAHDFNNLLAVVAGHAALLAEQVEGPAAARRSIARIREVTRRAGDLARVLLAHGGKAPLEPRVVDLSTWIRGMRGILEASLPTGVALDLRLGQGLEPVHVDPAQLGQVILNLVINAGEAVGTLEGRPGRVTVAVAPRQMGLEALTALAVPPEHPAPGPFLALLVRDDGPGMEPAVLERIFEPFFTTKFTGRGLGLASVMGVVRRMGGGIDVRSELGAGARFEVFIPARLAGPGEEVEAPPGSDKGWLPERVLLVDDDPEVRLMGQELLSSLGMSVTLAADGRELLARIRATPDAYDLVLLDVAMPEMDGVSALRALREIQPTVPVILASGFDVGQIEEELGPVERVAFLQKPYELGDLLAILRSSP